MDNHKNGDTGGKRTLVEEGTQFKGSLSSSCPIVVKGKIDGRRHGALAPGERYRSRARQGEGRRDRIAGRARGRVRRRRRFSSRAPSRTRPSSAPSRSR